MGKYGTKITWHMKLNVIRLAIYPKHVICVLIPVEETSSEKKINLSLKKPLVNIYDTQYVQERDL